jgi:hypothetical protein
MNPYLEQESVWHDFHERFCTVAAELLTGQVRPNYIVKIDEQVYIHELQAGSHHLLGRADVAVSRPHGEKPAGSSVAVLEAPARVRLPEVDVESLSFLEIRDRESWQLVTAVELLSYSNKYAGPDRDQYLAKRGRLLASAAHLVEIDLLRGGPRLPCEGLPDCAYYALVSRVEERFQAGVWPIQLRDRLPVIPIPLRAPHGDAHLDLQQILDRIYDAAGYEDYIYRGQPHPRLAPDDAAWIRQFVPAPPSAP